MSRNDRAENYSRARFPKVWKFVRLDREIFTEVRGGRFRDYPTRSGVSSGTEASETLKYRFDSSQSGNSRARNLRGTFRESSARERTRNVEETVAWNRHRETSFRGVSNVLYSMSFTDCAPTSSTRKFSTQESLTIRCAYTKRGHRDPLYHFARPLCIYDRKFCPRKPCLFRSEWIVPPCELFFRAPRILSVTRPI